MKIIDKLIGQGNTQEEAEIMLAEMVKRCMDGEAVEDVNDEHQLDEEFDDELLALVDAAEAAQLEAEEDEITDVEFEEPLEDEENLDEAGVE